MSYVDLHVKDGKVVATTTSDNDHIAELELDIERINKNAQTSFDRLTKENQRYREVIQDFINKVDSGRARSKDSYA
jgi:hypothetical protein